MKTIIIDLDTVAMVLDERERMDRLLCRDAIREIAYRIEDLCDERELDVLVERDYRTTGRSDDSADFHAEIEAVLVGQVDDIRYALCLVEDEL